MSTFDELRSLYIAWDDSHQQHHRDATQLALTFASGFSGYLGAPETYIDFNTRINKRYIQPMTATRDEDGIVHFDEPKTFLDVITRDENGYWTFGIKIVLDRMANAYPKSEFQYFIKFALRDRLCELHIGHEGGRKFELNLDSPDSMRQAYDFMLEMLRKVLTTQPWSTGEKAPIGFAVPETRKP